MSRNTTQPVRRVRRTLAAGLRAGGLLLAALGLIVGAGARAAEFITPPGLNVQSQEAVLKEQVTRMARDLVGDALRDVVVSIRYIRTDGATGKRIKLPGVNHFIMPSAAGGAGGDIVSGHVRVRQVLVTVDSRAEPTPEALAQELRQQGHFDPTQGDLVRVIKVQGGAGDAQAAPGDKELKDDAQQLSKRLKQEQDKQREERTSQELGRMIAEASLSEAQSTTFLIRARQAYFNGDYDRALEQILRSIEQNPNNPQAYAMLGSLYYTVDWKQLALKYWEKSLTLDPDNPEIQELVFKLRSSPANPGAGSPGRGAPGLGSPGRAN